MGSGIGLNWMQRHKLRIHLVWSDMSSLQLGWIASVAAHSPTTSPSQWIDSKARFRTVFQSPTYLRNTVFLSLALGYAEVIGAADLFIGVNAIDYSGYPDCRPAFIAEFEKLANVATKSGVEGTMQFHVHTPLIQMTKAGIIRRGTELGVDFGLTHSCYAPNVAGVACGRCDACQLRLKGFAEAGLMDPIAYQMK